MAAPARTTTGPARGGFSMGARFLLLSIACFALMILDHRDQHVERVRQALSVVVYPLRVLVDLPFRGWDSIRTNFATREALVAENEQLKRERLNAEFRLQRLAALETENARLRELLDSQARVGSRALIAEILAVDLDPYRQRFNLNRGLVDGVYVGQALIDAQGVVGQTVRVGPFTSEAVLITDADNAVPVSINRNGLRTIAVGTGRQRLAAAAVPDEQRGRREGRPARVVGARRRVPGGLPGRPHHGDPAASGSVVRRDHGGAGVRARSRPRGAARLERRRRSAARERAGEPQGAEAPSLAKAK